MKDVDDYLKVRHASAEMLMYQSPFGTTASLWTR
jgi:hypothetical protein